MAVLGAHGAPLRARVAGQVFNFIEGVLHERREVRAGVDVHAFEGIAGVDRQHRFGLHVIAPF